MKSNIWQSKGAALLMILCTALFVLSVSIAMPILCRPFFYLQIGPLGLEAETGLAKEEIMQAYAEMLNFCMGLSKEFSTGVLPWSEQGHAHFVDVRRLFLLDFGVAGMSGFVLLIDCFMRRRNSLPPHSLKGRSAGFWAGCGLLIVFGLIAGLAALDFGRAFTIFHSIFFPGKTNWIFSPEKDAVITILPEAFFRNCAILIVLLMVASCLLLIGRDIYRRRKQAPPHSEK